MLRERHPMGTDIYPVKRLGPELLAAPWLVVVVYYEPKSWLVDFDPKHCWQCKKLFPQHPICYCVT